MLTVSQLFIYPVKSLGGISVESADLSPMGFLHDRRWMLVDLQGRFITQREIPEMCLLQVGLLPNGLHVFHKRNQRNEILIPYQPKGTAWCTVQVFEDYCQALEVSADADKWFSEMLGVGCKLMFIPENSVRQVDSKYAPLGTRTGFSDGFPYLLIGQESLDDLNSRLDRKVSITRFRPNLVFSGGAPFEEDQMDQFAINGVNFMVVKPCARCTIPSVDPETGYRSEEPLRTLASYRKWNHKILFGQNLIAMGLGNISIGNQLTELKFHLSQAQ